MFYFELVTLQPECPAGQSPRGVLVVEQPLQAAVIGDNLELEALHVGPKLVNGP